MNELLGRTHNDIDGTFCYGMLTFSGLEFGSLGQICVYRCSVCGREIRNVEDRLGQTPQGFGPPPPFGFGPPPPFGFGPWG
ncbi:MAG: hypothetical protein J1D88_09005 [Treponema sp.]|nr:hypothetical protein [Treponema sp.]